MNLFGIKKKSPAVPKVNVTDTIMLIRNNLELLDKREQHINLKIEQATVEAREKSRRKDQKGTESSSISFEYLTRWYRGVGAVFCLKRKKLYESEIEKLQGARVTLEQQVIMSSFPH